MIQHKKEMHNLTLVMSTELTIPFVTMNKHSLLELGLLDPFDVMSTEANPSLFVY